MTEKVILTATFFVKELQILSHYIAPTPPPRLDYHVYHEIPQSTIDILFYTWSAIALLYFCLSLSFAIEQKLIKKSDGHNNPKWMKFFETRVHRSGFFFWLFIQLILAYDLYVTGYFFWSAPYNSFILVDPDWFYAFHYVVLNLVIQSRMMYASAAAVITTIETCTVKEKYRYLLNNLY